MDSPCGPQEWSYLRGGLSTIDRDYGIFNKIHHDIGTHVVHHLLPQIPHYNLPAATEAVKPVMGPYYRCGPLSALPLGVPLSPPLLSLWRYELRYSPFCPNLYPAPEEHALASLHGWEQR